MSNINQFFSSLLERLDSDPFIALLMLAVIFGFLQVGAILDWDWIVAQPPNSRFHWFWSLGRPKVRMILNFAFGMAMSLCLAGYFYFSMIYPRLAEN